MQPHGWVWGGYEIGFGTVAGKRRSFVLSRSEKHSHYLK